MGDSFDVNTGTNLVGSGVWTSGTTATISTTTRFNFGQSMYVYNGQTIVKDNLPSTANTVFFAFAINSQGGSSTNSIYLNGRESSVNQFKILFSGTGDINVKTNNDTTIATFTSALTPNQWTHVQIMVVIHPTAGEVHIRKNGNTVDDFVATGINTRSGTSNNYINGVQWYAPVGSTAYILVDDFLMFDNSGSSLNNWCGDVRCYLLYPSANGTENDFTPSVVTSVSTWWTGSSTLNMNANTLYVSQAMTSSNLAFPSGYANNPSLTSISFTLSSGITGHIVCAIYDGTATNVLAISTPLTNPISGTITFNFPSPVTLSTGYSFKWALLSDVSCVLVANSSTSWGSKSSYAYATYSTTFSTSPNPTTNNSYQPNFSATVTLTNWNNVSENGSNDGDTTYNYASSVGNVDLYSLQDLPITPASISVAQLRMVARKSDSGTRAGQTVLVSGGTTDLGTSTMLSSNYSHLIKVYPTDPHTGAVWTAAAINSLQIGGNVTV